MRRFSIRWRMTFWNTAAFAAVLAVFGFLVYESLSQIHYDQVDRALRAKFQELARDSRLDADPDELFLAWARELEKSTNLGGMVLDSSGQLVARSEPLADAQAVPVSYPATTNTRGEPRYDVVTVPQFGRARRLTGRLTAGDKRYTVVLLAELEHLDEEMGLVLQVLLFTIPVTLLVAAALGYWLARKSLAPVDQLRQLTDEITAENLDRRLPVGNGADELGALAHTINSMISRLERSFSEVRRFTADASHELRTPLSVIHSEAEMGLGGEATLTDARERLASILEECSRLTSMTDQLLALCREDAGVSAGSATPVPLAPLVADAVDALRPAATAKSQQLSLSCQDSPVVLGDGERLRRVLYNLLDNAIKYTPCRGAIQVQLDQRGDQAVLTIRDTGTGIPAEHLPHVFDRFYRARVEPSALSPGAGLGLSIVKSIIAAHRGKVEVDSDVGRGTVFRIFLPLAPKGAVVAG